jgi:hypothetical protein
VSKLAGARKLQSLDLADPEVDLTFTGGMRKLQHLNVRGAPLGELLAGTSVPPLRGLTVGDGGAITDLTFDMISQKLPSSSALLFPYGPPD